MPIGVIARQSWLTLGDRVIFEVKFFFMIYLLFFVSYLWKTASCGLWCKMVLHCESEKNKTLYSCRWLREIL